MAISLLSFPNEILILIISQISNADLDNFTSACQRFQALGADTLREHRIRKQVFTHISCGNHIRLDENWMVGKEKTWGHPTLMLRDLIRDDLLCYPTTFSFNDPGSYDAFCDDYDSDSDSVSDSENGTDRCSEVDRALKSFAKDVQPLIEMCPCFDGNEDLSRGVLGGDIGATLGLLLNVLPNLRRLKIADFRERSLGEGSLKRILDNMLITSQNPQEGSTPPLSKLKSVIFKRHGTEVYKPDNVSLSTFAPLFYFPSMRVFRADYLRANEDSWTYPGVLSHINRLEFYMSTINDKDLKTCLKATQDLMHFEYVGDCDVLYGQSRPPIRELTQTVLEQVGYTLRYLDIQCWADHYNLCRAGGHFVGFLKAFRVLETVQVGGSMFVEPVETTDRIFADPVSTRKGRTRRLIDILPPSVVRITFNSEIGFPGSGIEGDVATMLQSLPESKADLLPHLELVTFDLNEPEETIIIDSELLHNCDKAGVKIVVQID